MFSYRSNGVQDTEGNYTLQTDDVLLLPDASLLLDDVNILPENISLLTEEVTLLPEDVPLLLQSNTVTKENVTSTNDNSNGNIHFCSEESESDLPDLIIEKDENYVPWEECIQGNRCVNIAHFIKQISLIEIHRNKCTMGKFIVKSEKRCGLFSTWTFACDTCNETKTVTSHDDIQDEEINDAVVWGALSIGIGYSQVEELLSVMNIPSMSCTKFRMHEEKIGQV